MLQKPDPQQVAASLQIERAVEAYVNLEECRSDVFYLTVLLLFTVLATTKASTQRG